VASWNLSSLKITPPAEFEGCFTLTVAATERDSEGDISAPVTATEVVTVAPVAEPPTASAPATAATAANTAIDVRGVVVGPAAEDADDTAIVLLTVAHGALAVSPVAGVTETANCPGSLTVSGTAGDINTALASLVYTPTKCFTGCDTLNVSVTSQDGSDTYPTQATAATAIKVTPDSESLVVGGPGPTLDWNDPANWSAGIVPTLGIDATINAPCNYEVIITGAHAQAESLTIPHGAASTDVIVSGTLQLAGDLDVSYSGKFENDGTLEETANATFIGPITNNGTITADSNIQLDVTGIITGIGKFAIDSGATLEFAPGSKVAPGTTDSQTIYFEQGAAKLIIDDCGKFDGVITGTAIGTHLTPTDLIDLAQLPYVGGSMSVSIAYNSGTNISTMTFGDGISANNVTLHLSGNYTGTAWFFTSINGGAGTEIYDPPMDSSTLTNGATAEIAVASAAQVAPVGTVGAAGDSFHFKDEISGSEGSGVIDVAELSDTQTSMSHHEDAAGTNGPLAISGIGETPGAPGDSFHFKNGVSSSQGSGVSDLAQPGQILASMSHFNAVGTPVPSTISDGAHASELPPLAQHPDDHFNIVPQQWPSAIHVQHDLIV